MSVAGRSYSTFWCNGALRHMRPTLQVAPPSRGSHTIPNQHFAHIGTSPTPSYLSTLPAARYQASRTRSRTIYYHIPIVFMLNSCIVQVLCFGLGCHARRSLPSWRFKFQMPNWEHGFATHGYSCISSRRLKMAALCYADKFVTERTDDVSECAD